MLSKIEIASGQFLIVELQQHEISPDIENVLPELVADAQKRGRPLDNDVQHVSKENLKKASELLKSQIENLASIVHSSVKSAAPHSAVVEASIGFSGETDIIPFITSVQSNGSIKIKLEWNFEN